jgi:hypothetical protein
LPFAHHRARAARLLAAAAIVTSAALAAPSPAPAQTAPEGPATQRGEVGPSTGQASEVASGIDVFRGNDSDVIAALDDLDATVGAELRALEGARAKLARAEAATDRAAAAVAETQARIDELTAQSDDVVAEAFMNPPSDSAIDVLSAPSLSDLSVKSSIVDLQTSADASVLEELDAARAEVKSLKADRADAAAAAKANSDDAAAAMADLEAAQSQLTAFVLQVQARVDQRLAEADSLANLDPALAAQLRQQESAIAARLEALRRDREQQRALEALQKAQAEAAARRAAEEKAAAEAAHGGALGPATGSLSTVACPSGGSITVDSSLAANLSSLLAAASSAGLGMCGNGYRDPAAQIAVRRANCGTSYYAIYEAPSSSCSPPTAPPGTSNHEQGLAIDFTCGGTTVSGGSACFDWLRSHAASYGLHNLPSEPWHWSNDGT